MLAEITSIVARSLRVPPDSLTPEAGPDSVAEWDSLATMEIYLAIEETYGVAFSDEEVATLETIGEIAQATARKRDGAARG